MGIVFLCVKGLLLNNCAVKYDQASQSQQELTETRDSDGITEEAVLIQVGCICVCAGFFYFEQKKKKTYQHSSHTNERYA